MVVQVAVEDIDISVESRRTKLSVQSERKDTECYKCGLNGYIRADYPQLAVKAKEEQ